MAIQLERILGGLTASPGSTQANPNYTSGTLTGTTNYMKEFSEMDTSTTEGLNKYKQLTGLPTKNISEKKINLTARQIMAEVGERFDGYTHSHITPITNELEEGIRTIIGYNFCPEEKSNSQKYENARTTIGSAKKTIETIEKDSKKYIETEISKAPDFMKGIIGRFANEVCAIDAKDARDKAFGAIQNYGSTKFITDTYGHQVSAEKGLQEKMAELGKEKEKLEKNMKIGLDAESQAKYFAPITKKEKALMEIANKITNPKKLKETLVQNAIATINDKQKQTP